MRHKSVIVHTDIPTAEESPPRRCFACCKTRELLYTVDSDDFVPIYFRHAGSSPRQKKFLRYSLYACTSLNALTHFPVGR